MSDESARWARMQARTFRWTAAEDTSGYSAAEVVPGRVLWLTWSHVHGEGRRELGAQTMEQVRADGPAVSVPSQVLEEILAALAQGRP